MRNLNSGENSQQFFLFLHFRLGKFDENLKEGEEDNGGGGGLHNLLDMYSSISLDYLVFLLLGIFLSLSLSLYLIIWIFYEF